MMGSLLLSSVIQTPWVRSFAPLRMTAEVVGVSVKRQLGAASDTDALDRVKEFVERRWRSARNDPPKSFFILDDVSFAGIAVWKFDNAT